MGTGTSFVLCDGDDMRHIGGIGVGGGTLAGLSRLLLNTSDIKQVASFAMQGDVQNVDLLIGDISAEPLPNLPMDDDDERGMFSRFKEFLRGIYTTKETTNQVLSTMKKKLFSVIAAILAVETFECEEGGCASLTDEQLTTLENHINTLQGQVDEAHTQMVERDKVIEGLKAQIVAKDAEIAGLSKQPAAATQQVTNQNQAAAEPSQLQDYCAEVSEAREMLNQLKK